MLAAEALFTMRTPRDIRILPEPLLFAAISADSQSLSAQAALARLIVEALTGARYSILNTEIRSLTLAANAIIHDLIRGDREEFGFCMELVSDLLRANQVDLWIHHNVVENVDRAFVWMNEGKAENIQVYNNTVICAVAGTRKGAVLGSYSGERMEKWSVCNNVFVAPAEEPRKLCDDGRGQPSKVGVRDNLRETVSGSCVQAGT